MLNDIKKNPMYRYLLLLTITSIVGLQGWRTLFNNFAVDAAGINGFQMGIIQSVREIPGFLSLLVVYILLVVKEHRLSAISVLILGAGVLATGFMPSFEGLMLTTFIMSVGFHYFETTNQSLTLQYFTGLQSAVVFARLKSLSALTNVFVGVSIWGLSYFLSLTSLFAIVGGVVICAAVYAMKIDPADKELPAQNTKMIIKKEYFLFYMLNFLNGARRQIFVVFAVFLLVQRYGFSVQAITVLFVINNIINYFITPYIGKAINRFGERRMLSLEYGSLIVIFISYAIFDNGYVAACLYVLDHIFFNFAIAIKTYFQKTADPMDIAPSMAVGFTMNHIAAVVVPVFGGILWLVDYRIPFIAASALSFFSLICVQKIKVKA